MSGGLIGRQNGGGVSHLASFLLGALLPTALLFFFASDRLGERLFGSGAGLPSPASHAPEGDLVAVGSSAAAAEKHAFPGLAELLPKVASDDRTVIITSVNEAWARPGALLDLFLESFRGGEGTGRLLDHVLVVAVDAGGFRRCAAVHPHCYLLEDKAMNLSAANRFMTKEYLELVWIKLSLQQRVLELGYSFLFSDVDIMWLRDPFRHISLYADMAVSTDRFNGDRYDLTNSANTGFYYVKSTNKTVEMLRYWQAARSRLPRGQHDQQVFDEVKPELAGGELRVKIEFLETALFGGFCQYYSEMERVCTMHANCCIGLENKVHDLKNVLADWRNYTSLLPPEKKGGNFRWTFPARCSASMHG